MNDASMWRLTLAQKVLAPYVANPKVRVVEIAGSVGYGFADRYSDLDVLVFWDAPPSDEERMVAIKNVQAVVVSFHPYDDQTQQGTEVYFVAGDPATGIMFDVSHQLVAGVEQLLAEVLDQGDSIFKKQRAVGGIQHAAVLHGAELAAQWQARATVYPNALARATVQQFLTFGPHWTLEMLAERGEVLFLRDICWEAIYKILPVLMGLNGIYYHSFKYLHRHLANIPIAPPDLWPRLLQVLRADVHTSSDLLRALIAETFLLVETHLPELDTTEARQRWEQPAPANITAVDGTRQAVLRQATSLYAANSAIQAVILTGSVAQGYPDRFSDLDLIVVWTELPSVEIRHGLLRQAGTKVQQLDLPNPEEPASVDYCDVDEIRLDIRHVTVTEIEGLLHDVLEKADTALPKQPLLAGLQHGRALYGTALAQQWQVRLNSYPPALVHAMVREHLDFGPHWRWEGLAERDDVLFLYAWMLGELRNIVTVLAALNHIYHPAQMWANWFPKVKWFDHFAASLRITPTDFAARCKQVLAMETPVARAVLYALIEETFTLVEMHMPEIDTAAAKVEFRHRRKGWDQAPDNLLS
ncbi:MAG: nucleotidyltransferase domain-containing protein [Herpetosiphonaceae bacterium]|nr:nucleotidyltransferase domain-containing protein [Herpetosiphonaceae bacterium]